MNPKDPAVSKATWRLVPYLFLCYIFNYLDRFNISFAAMEMKADLGFGDAVYGFGASVFFIGYALFEVPSNLILERVGAKVWMSRIMVTWGIASACMACVKTSSGFYLLRFFLGVAEAGFFPGVIYYLSHWIPSRERANVYALFIASTALSGVLGGPLYAALLNLRGVAGLAGWQWLFLLEGLPPILLGVITFFYLTDSPREAHWLTPDERESLAKTMEAENSEKRVRHPFTLFESLAHPRVWELCAVYFFTIISFYGVSFWLPQIVKNFSGLDNQQVSLVSALPFLAAAVGMVVIARHSDKTGERRWHVALPAFVGCLGLTVGAWAQQDHPWAAFGLLCVTAVGIWGTLGPFWSMPTRFLNGSAAAGCIALINSAGQVGGFLGPNILGFVKEKTHHFESGMLVLALTLLVAGFLALWVKEER